MRSRNILILAVILVVLAGVFYLVSRPKPTTPVKPTVYVWSIEMDDIKHITLSLPREGLSQSFIKIPQDSQFPWFFDDPPKYSSVNATRWGGGITLLLSGPGADRVIAENATEAKLAEFGLLQPRLEITLTLQNDSIMNISVGDNTPDGNNYYVRAPGSNTVATVDYTWYDVLAKLVREPPYATKS